MGIIIYVLADVLHLLKILCFCNLIFMFHKRKRISFMSLFIGMMALSVCFYSIKANLISSLVYIVVLCIAIYMIYDEKRYVLLFCGLWIIFLISMLDLMSTELVHIVCGLINRSNERVEELVAALFSFLFILTVGKVYSNKYRVGIKKIGMVKLFFFMILAIADTYAVMIMTAVSNERILGNYKLGYIISFFIVIIGIFIQLASVILLIISRDTYKEKEEITQKYLDEQIKHYKYLEQREKDTKKFRHDIKNHMQVLSVMTKNGMYSNFDSYMEEINMQIDRLGNVITVNNGIVDAIINKYYSEALQKGIDINIKGMLSNECSITPYDLCTIFSNLLSNAVEAAEKAVEKRISMECRYTDDSIIIITKNTFKDEGQFRHSKIITTKNDIEYHGFGIDNIKDAVERNNGMLDIDIKDSIFTIILKLSN